MQFQVGRYARITKLGLKYSGKDGFIKSFDNMYVILKMIENSQCIRVLRKNVTVHHTALMIRSSDGELGTLVNSNFTPTVTRRPESAGRSNFKPYFFRTGQQVRIMNNSKMVVASIKTIDISAGIAAVRLADDSNMIVTRRLVDMRLTLDSKIHETLTASKLSRVVEPPKQEAKPVSESNDVEYELTVIKTNVAKTVTHFVSKEAMKEYIDKLLSPYNIQSIEYREVKRTFGPKIALKVVQSIDTGDL